MISEDLFHENNLDVFIPNDGVEFIYSILQNVGYRDFTSTQARTHGLQIIRQLVKMDLIEVFHWGEHHEMLSNLNLDENQTIQLIENIWFPGADYSDFLGIPMFGHKAWYLEALKKVGLTSTTDWKTFVKENIGDMEQWIMENRPEKKT